MTEREAAITPAMLGRILAEAKSFQALAALHLRGDVAMAIHWPKNGEKVGLIYALAEAVDNDESPEGA